MIQKMVEKIEAAITDTLSCLDENIFIIDMEYRISWMNQSAENFIDVIKPYLKLEDAKDIIGLNISHFHKNPSYQEEMLEKGDFPLDMQLVLFNKFIARLVVKELIVKEEKIGYVLVWKDVTEIEKEREKTRELIDQLSTPILPAIVENTLLVPLVGELSLERIERLTAKLLNECLKNEAEYVLIDFSGVTELPDTELGYEIDKLTSAVELMGAKVIYCGFPKEMVKNMVSLGVKTDQLSFVSFRTAIRYVVTEMGYKLEK